MSAQPFALTSPSLTDMSDAINLSDARARFYDAERQGEAALAAWARTYAPPLLNFAGDAPTEEAVTEAAKEAREEAATEADTAHAHEIEDLLGSVEPAFQKLTELQKKLRSIAERSRAAA